MTQRTPTRRTARRTFTAASAAAFLVLALPVPARLDGQEFHLASVGLLHGTGFHDQAAGNATSDGRMTTLTVESVSAWRYGDVFFFADLSTGDFADGPTGRHRVYAELAPRVSMSRVTGRRWGVGPVGDVLVAAGVDRAGSGFAATLVGLGTDLRLPGVPVAQLNVYRRDDTFNRPTYQVTGVWSAPVRTGPLRWTVAGFVDVAGTDAGTDVMTQPQLLLDVGALAAAPGRLQAGVEWYLHRAPGTRASAPQLMLRWSW